MPTGENTTSTRAPVWPSRRARGRDRAGERRLRGDAAVWVRGDAAVWVRGDAAVWVRGRDGRSSVHQISVEPDDAALVAAEPRRRSEDPPYRLDLPKRPW